MVTITEISKGEEVTISYAGNSLGYEDLKKVVLERHKFVCKCRKCSGGMIKQEEVDEEEMEPKASEIVMPEK